SLSGADMTSQAPPVALLVALLLAFVGVALLIFFIHHISLGLRISNIVVSIAHESLAAVDRHCRDGDADPGDADPVDVTSPQGRHHVVRARDSGYVIGVSLGSLTDLAVEMEGCIRVVRGSGTFVTRGEVIADLQTPRDDLGDAL